MIRLDAKIACSTKNKIFLCLPSFLCFSFLSDVTVLAFIRGTVANPTEGPTSPSTLNGSQGNVQK